MFYNVTNCVLNNGHASTFFSLQRGVRQGCPLPGVLFVLDKELISRSVKNDPTIRGIQVNKRELKICQYADDTTVVVRDLDSITSLLRVLNDFKEHSGLEINTTKTEANLLSFGARCPRSLYPRNKQTNFQLYLAREAPKIKRNTTIGEKEDWRIENVRF